MKEIDQVLGIGGANTNKLNASIGDNEVSAGRHAAV